MDYWTRRDAVLSFEEIGKAVVVPKYEEWTFNVAPAGAWSMRYCRGMVRTIAIPEFAEYIKRSRSPGYVQTDVDAKLDRRLQIATFVEGCLVSTNAKNRKGDAITGAAEMAEFFSHFGDVFDYLKAYAANEANFDPVTDDVKMETARGNLRRASSTRSGSGAKA